MEISSVDDCRRVFAEAEHEDRIRPYGLDGLGVRMMESLEYMIKEHDAAKYKLTTIRDAVEKAIGYIAPSNSSYDILNDVLQDTQ